MMIIIIIRNNNNNNKRKLLVIWLLRGGTEVKHWLKMSHQLEETHDLIYIHWRVLKINRSYIRSKLKTCGSRAQYIYQTMTETV